jgi:hypothetical protein
LAGFLKKRWKKGLTESVKWQEPTRRKTCRSGQTGQRDFKTENGAEMAPFLLYLL